MLAFSHISIYGLMLEFSLRGLKQPNDGSEGRVVKIAKWYLLATLDIIGFGSEFRVPESPSVSGSSSTEGKSGSSQQMHTIQSSILAVHPKSLRSHQRDFPPASCIPSG